MTPKERFASVATTEWNPTTATELRRIVADNYNGEKISFSPCGGRTSISSLARGDSDSAILLTSQLNRIIAYPSRDMTITVEAGIRIEALQQALSEENQRLPIDIPQAGRASLGGAIAANVSGPCRFGYGTFRDYVIGITAVDGQGRLFSSGGQVVKNVAGYDLCKLLVGSRGGLATITEVTLKLRPQSEAQMIVLAAFDPKLSLEPVLADLILSETRPSVIDLLNAKGVWQLNGEANQKLPKDKNLLWIEFEGTSDEVDWQVKTIQQELKNHRPDDILTIQGTEYQAAHEALVEFQTTSDDPLTFQISFPKSQTDEFLALALKHEISLQVHAGNGVAYGHLPDRCTTAAVANSCLQPIRQLAENAGGSLQVFSTDPEWFNEIDFIGHRSNAWKLMKAIKNTLDPASLMNSELF